MNRFKSALAALTLLSALVAPAAHAELLLTGKLYGNFDPLSPGDVGFANTTIQNTTTQSIFRSGAQFQNGGRTRLTMTDKTFSNKGSGDLLALNFFELFNAPTLVGTTAEFATIDLYLDLSSIGVSNFLLTTVTFDIDNTANNGTQNIPDLFYIEHTPLNSLMVGFTKITFDLLFPETYETFPGQSLPERSGDTTGELYASFSAVPEPSTYALFGTVLLVGVVAYRRKAVRASAVAAV